MEKILTWKEVVITHRSIAGISTKGGYVVSILCNPGSDQNYPNKIMNKKILYYVGKNTNSNGINALFNSIKKRNSFPVFEKIAVNKWRNIGAFKATSVKEKADGYVEFNLDKD